MDRLPNEIIYYIVSYGNQAQWIHVSKRHYDIALPWLYKNIVLRLTDETVARSFALGIANKTSAAGSKTLILRIMVPEKTTNFSMAFLGLALKYLVNLQVFHIFVESKISLADALQNVRFPQLHTLTIALRDPPAAPVPRLFFPLLSNHPKIRNFSLQCLPYHQALNGQTSIDDLRPTFPSLPCLEYIAAPWDYFSRLLLSAPTRAPKSATLKELNSATIDFGIGGMGELEHMFVALKSSVAAKKLTTLVCLKQRKYNNLLDYISSQIPTLEFLTIRCDAPEAFNQFAYLERMRKLKRFSLISSAGWIAKERAKIDAIQDEQFLVLPPCLEKVELYNIPWTREDGAWKRGTTV